MNNDRVSTVVKNRRPKVKNGLSIENREKSKSDDGFHHSDSDKDSNHSSHSNMSSSSTTNISSHPLSRNSSVKSDTVARVRPKSSLGMLTEKTKSDSLNLATVAANKQLKADRQAEEARKNRKIADLEISIKSLMKINSELDATNKKQAIEIQDLARRLQMYVNSEENRKESDIRFRKICLVIDTLIRDGKNALEYKSKIGGSRVLTNVQLDKQLTQSSEYADGNSSLITNSGVCVVDNSNKRRIRIHSIINQLLSLARWGEENNNNNNNNNNFFSASPSSIPTTPKTPEPKGLGLLLSDPTPHIPHIPNFTYTSNDAKISRRRSSPNFRSSSSSSFIISDRMLDATNSSISTITTTSDVLKPPSIWSSSLGFLAPWKHD
nr:10457_t:CDS:2 [Entrophospora candida]